MNEAGGKPTMTTYSIFFCPDCGRRSDEPPRIACTCAAGCGGDPAQNDETAALSLELTRSIVKGRGR